MYIIVDDKSFKNVVIVDYIVKFGIIGFFIFYVLYII